VHPVIRQLPQEYHIRVEQGLLKTFGRVMPVLMTLCVILSVSYAISLNSVGGAARIVRWASVASFRFGVNETVCRGRVTHRMRRKLYGVAKQINQNLSQFAFIAAHVSP
jgi:hypothetical protein